MSEQITELMKKEVLRMSNKESKALTKECIRLALLHLLNDKSYEEISVTDIIRRSGVSRGGFYRNYASKDAVMNDILAEFLEDMTGSVSKSEYIKDNKKWMINIFREVYDRQDFYRLLFQADVPKEYLFRMGKEVKQRFPLETGQSYYYYIALGASLKALLTEWFQSGMKESPEEMAEFILSIFQFA